MGPVVTRRQFLYASSGLAVAAVTGCTPDDPAPTTGPSPSADSPSPSATSASPTPTPTPSSTPTPAPTPTGSPKPEVAGTIADDFDVPWGLIFLAGGDALVSERNSAKIIRVSAKGKKTTLGEVSGVVPPTGIGEGGLLGIATAPGDEDTLFVYYTTGSDNRVGHLSLAGGRVGKPKAVLTDIPTNTHHHGGRLLFDDDGMLLVATGDAEQSESGPGPGLAGRQDPADPARRPRRLGQPLRQPDLVVRSPQRRGTRLRRRRSAVGDGVRRQGGRRAQPDQQGQELRLARRRGGLGRRQLHRSQGDLVPHQQLLARRHRDHPVDGVRRRPARSVPVRRTAGRVEGRQTEGLLRRGPRSDPQRRRRARRLAVDDDLEHRRSSRPRHERRQDPARHAVVAAGSRRRIDPLLC